MSEQMLSHKDILKKFRGIISVLRYLVATRQFSYVDRLAAAMSPDEVGAVITESLRTIRSALDSALDIVGTNGEKLKCCEVDPESPPPYAEGVAVRVKVKECRARSDLAGKEVTCYVCPKLPHEYEVADFLNLTSKDLEVARTVAAYALTIPYRSGG